MQNKQMNLLRILVKAEEKEILNFSALSLAVVQLTEKIKAQLEI